MENNFGRKKKKGVPHQLLKGKSRIPFKNLSNISTGASHLRKKRRSRGSAESIQVTVRVRPLVKHELGYTNIVHAHGNNICLQNPNSDEIKAYSYDTIYTSSNDAEYDQQFVCGAIAKSILTNANQGYNSCCFCYGQTGSGKTYTMMSSQMNPKSPDGILPQVCRGLFQQAQSASQNFVSDIKYEISIGMIEIYNDKLRDLLYENGPNSGFSGPPPPLTILDSGDVVNLRTVKAETYPDCLSLIDRGLKIRNIAATALNDNSSRSHIIVQLRFSQNFSYMGNTIKKLDSRINLIDLAGSERTKKSQTKGIRQKEGISINTSLTHLGTCIRKLSDSKTHQHVPFRNSKLTYLLKNSLVGNSKTLVCVNISPSSSNFEESKMSLDFAERMKNIKTDAKINEDLAIKKNLDRLESKRIKEMELKMVEVEQKNNERIEKMKDEWAVELEELERSQNETFQINLDILESENEKLHQENRDLKNKMSQIEKEFGSVGNLWNVFGKVMSKHGAESIKDLENMI